MISEPHDLSAPNIPSAASDSPPSLIQSSSIFTCANIFGLFLTIQICQLTQPYGSLLFRGTHGWFWRVSPLASLEGCIMEEFTGVQCYSRSLTSPQKPS
ncbi:hypothetical protein PILCRDRAFT_15962 [Piloderma croceum F 1598]|uniref:Uncharacterized protein n=1 Tax=Piloderma croceum (strain F 1598) TaxID=765440 RepID=A0A0C3AFQ9_PILCF|nr:hypothetical protein PILCRDRAFT_15962 [Piloderma croceum F 1598]